MERIGEKLRRRREELGFTIDDIAKATKYRPDVIRAVEEGRTGVFPAEAYRQAFLRAYAGKLGLDAAEILREQKSEEERVQEALKGIRVRPGKRTSIRRTLVWLAVVVVVAVGLLVLYDRVIKERVMPGPPANYEHLQGAAPDSAGTQRLDSLTTVGPEDSIGTGPDMEGGEHREDDETIGSDNPGADEALSDRSEPEGPTSLVAGTPEAGTSAVGGRPAVSASDSPTEDLTHDATGVGGSVSIETKDWLAVSVRDYAVRATLSAGDSIIVDRWLRPGFRDTFYSSRPFWADTIIGQENAMLLVLNGKRVDLPRPRGNVITGFRISP